MLYTYVQTDTHLFFTTHQPKAVLSLAQFKVCTDYFLKWAHDILLLFLLLGYILQHRRSPFICGIVLWLSHNAYLLFICFSSHNSCHQYWTNVRVCLKYAKPALLRAYLRFSFDIISSYFILSLPLSSSIVVNWQALDDAVFIVWLSCFFQKLHVYGFSFFFSKKKKTRSLGKIFRHSIVHTSFYIRHGKMCA